MRNQVPLIVLFILIILIAINYFFTKWDGFIDVSASHTNYVDVQEKNYNPLGLSLIAARTQGILGNNANALMETVGVDKTYELNDKKTGLFAIIEKCESVKTNDCSAFDNPAFSKDCGVCLDIGTNSNEVASTGGLVLLPDDRKFAKSITKGNAVPDYKATVGSCPANRLVSSKAECISMKRKIECEKNATYDLKECSQCYSDQSYTIVDSNPSAGVISGAGTIYLTGNGTLGYTETGYGSKSGITLSSTPHVIRLQGPETTRLSITVTAPSNGSQATLSGYLGGKTATGDFTLDLYRIVLTDTTTGRKPRTVDMTSMGGVDVTVMAAGFGKDQMTLVVPTPFTFVDPATEQASLCKDTPFVTKQASAEFLNSDPCYKKGSGPGKFSLECLQGSFLANGCTEAGKAYPSTAAAADKLMTKSNGSYRTLNEIAGVVYTNAVSSSTGVGPDGKKLEVTDWSKASEFCTGKTISSPCDTDAKASGPLSTDCLIYLWNNGGGKKNAAGVVDQSLATYSIISMASSLFSKNDNSRFCQAKGTLSPMDANGAINTAAVDYWKKKGGVDAVKAEMKKIHTMANSDSITDNERIVYLRQCYGVDKLAVPIEGASYPGEPTIAGSKYETYELSTGRIAAYTNIPRGDYSLSFDIRIKDVVSSNFASIIVTTNGEGDCCAVGMRAPGIWLMPNSTRMYIILGDTTNGDWGFNTDALPIGKKVSFSLVTSGKDITCVVNGKTYKHTQPTSRPTGKNFMVYMGNRYYPPANAGITSLKYTVDGTPVDILAKGSRPLLLPAELIKLDLHVDTKNSGTDSRGLTIHGNCPLGMIDGRRGIYFNGSFANYISFPYPQLKKWTMTWLFYLNTKGYHTMASICEPSFSRAVFQSDLAETNVRLIGALPHNWAPTVDPYVHTLKRWNHIAYTYDESASRLSIFMNGKHNGTITGSGPFPSIPNPIVVIGRSGDFGRRGFDGYISEFKLFEGVLSEENIRNVYSKIRPVETKEAYGNNGTVSCERYCGGINGVSWGGSLPHEWNGATCIGSASHPNVNCNTTLGFTASGISCTCRHTGTGWK